jgi:uncharacterized protein (TIGR02466 family)
MSDSIFNIEHFVYFPSSISTVDGFGFLDLVSAVANEELEKTKIQHPKLDEIYPVRITGNLVENARLQEFNDFVATSAWQVLTHQGYATENMGMFLSEIWVQEHHKHSLMEQHVHGSGLQMIGFYFLNAPENCSKAIFHDPRPGKVQTNLPEKDVSQATFGSNMVNFSPKPGMLLLTNSWLPHSFTRHASEEPLLFVHLNLGVQFGIRPSTQSAEVI